jgi:putative membrane protein
VIFWIGGNDDAGKTLVIYSCLFMVLAGFVHFVSDRLALSRTRGIGVGGRWPRAARRVLHSSQRG